MDESQEAKLQALGYAERWVAKHPYLAKKEEHALAQKFAATARHMGVPMKRVVGVMTVWLDRTSKQVHRIIDDSTDILRRK
jgi:hypothetical protein